MHSILGTSTWPPPGWHALPYAGRESRSITAQMSGVRDEAMLRRGLWLGLLILLGGCWGGSEPGSELRVGSLAPEAMRVDGQDALVIAGSVDDCLSCDLLGLFVALRALQHSQAPTPAPEVLFLAISNRASDTLYFRQTMRRERVKGRITSVLPRVAAKLFVPGRLPAMYLVGSGVIVGAWEPSIEQRLVTIERDELLRLIESRVSSEPGH